jgi:2-hydroxychromene-2-carboxylate isomerase
MRLNKICKHYNVKLEIRVMMPMVMRGLPVPIAKAMFILNDCTREARVNGLTFGYCCDPINPEGIPVKRALDAYVVAQKYNKEIEYIEAFSEFVWGKGYDAGTDYGLKCIIDKCDLPWNEVKACLENPDIESIWSEMTLNNRKDISDQGLWGVPCIAYKDLFLWGQDKIWAIEKALELDIQKKENKNEELSNRDEIKHVEEKEENINSKKKKKNKNKSKK